MLVLDSTDEMTIAALGKVVEHLHRLDSERRQDLANSIANAVGEVFGGT